MVTKGAFGYIIGKKKRIMIVNDDADLLWQILVREIYVLMKHFVTKEELQKAFEAKNVDLILKYSADIGHYIGDAHVPLHTTENYNGQMTGQKGIHGLWESRLVEINAEDYDYFIGEELCDDFVGIGYDNGDRGIAFMDESGDLDFDNCEDSGVIELDGYKIKYITFVN